MTGSAGLGLVIFLELPTFLVMDIDWDKKVDDLRRTGFGGEAYLDLCMSLRWLHKHPGERPPHFPANQPNAFVRLIYDFIQSEAATARQRLKLS
jgi:hypothetical protein